ncbi:hypothetical protein [Saccharopolyspora hattusasensis]|uniref:hypothetical protein n=1 Tax=Saccharopolyspora hattusasensis TaxID=1128679 RepID=UPI003D97DCCF
MTYTLLGADGRPYVSAAPGRLGGYRRGRIYGRLDCPSALRAIADGGYMAHRVFFADEATARAAATGPARCACPIGTGSGRTARTIGTASLATEDLIALGGVGTFDGLRGATRDGGT